MPRTRAPLLLLASTLAACDSATAPPSPTAPPPALQVSRFDRGYAATRLPIEPWGINDSGVVVGSQGAEAVRHRNGATTVLRRAVGVGGAYVGTAINRQGAMAGHVVFGRGMFWRGPNSVPLQIVAPENAPIKVRALNASNVVVGVFRHANGEHAFRWTSGGGLVDITPRGFTRAEALDINDQGYVVGWGVEEGSGTFRALRWAPGAVSAATVLPGTHATAHAIRHDGLAIGTVSTLLALRAWTLAGFTSTLAGPEGSTPTDITGLGRVVGTTVPGLAQGFHRRPWTTFDGALTWLPVPDEANSHEASARGANGCGSIVGVQELHDGTRWGLLWTKFSCDLGGILQP